MNWVGKGSFATAICRNATRGSTVIGIKLLPQLCNYLFFHIATLLQAHKS